MNNTLIKADIGWYADYKNGELVNSYRVVFWKNDKNHNVTALIVMPDSPVLRNAPFEDFLGYSYYPLLKARNIDTELIVEPY